MNIATLYHEPRVYAYTLPEVPKLAVEDSWQKFLEGHDDFHEWRFVSNSQTSL